jgi:two-component system, NarL family, response regulator LiaR
VTILAHVINGNASNRTPTYDAEARPSLRVLLINADPWARRALCQALRDAHAFEVVGEVATIEEGILTVSATQPDLVVLDTSIARTTVAGIVSSILARAPAAKIVILAGEVDEQLALDALHAGAAGFLGREINLRALMRTLRGAAAGEAAVSRRLAGRLMELARERPTRRLGMRPVKSQLTAREWEVLELASASESKLAIALALGVSPGTVRSHLRNLSRKLAGGECAWPARQGD